MTKDIKEFLPLYLGQKCQTPFGVLIMDRFQMTGRYKAWFSARTKLNESIIHSNGLEGKSFLTSEFKLILRPISSMTEEEAIKIADIVIGSFDSVKWKVEKKLSSKGEFAYFDIHKKHRGYSKSLSIDECGEIDVYEDGNITMYLHQHEVTRTLLKMGFDLFKLHKAGLCLYETDLQTLKN